MTGIPFTDSEVFIGLLEDGTEDNDQGEDKIKPSEGNTNEGIPLRLQN